MSYLIPVVWIVIAFLYVANRRMAIAVYFVSLVAFPFYWAPLNVLPFNSLSIQHFVAIGIGAGVIVETLGEFSRRNVNVSRLTIELLVLSMVTIWSLSALDVATITGAVRNSIFNDLDFVVPFSVAIRSASTVDGVRFVLRWIAWPAIAIGVITFYEYVVQQPVVWNWFASVHYAPSADQWTPGLRAGILRVQATLGQSIFLAFYLVAAGLLWFALYGHSTGAKRVAAFAAGAFLLVCSVLPLARGAILGIAISLLLFTLLVDGRVRLRLVGSLALIALIPNLTSVYADQTSSFLSDFILTLVGQAPLSVQSSQLATFDARVLIIQVGSELMARAPLLGYGTLAVAGSTPLRDVANVFIEVGIVSGPVGLAMLIVFLLSVGIRLARSLRVEHVPERRILVGALLCVSAVTVICWLDSSWPGQLVQIQWLIFGLTLGWPASLEDDGGSMLVTTVNTRPISASA